MPKYSSYESSRLKKIKSGAYNKRDDDKKWYDNGLPEQKKDDGNFHLSLKDSVEVIAENLYLAQKKRKKLEQKGRQNTKKYQNLVGDIADFLDRLGNRVSEVNKEYKRLLDQ
ncbi:hypothetical protein GF361_02545 [Candidatus Woesearchaeota archaeon]|nr:hypothetical protein [Candidatus Woesearchaeota archaeon]